MSELLLNPAFYVLGNGTVSLGSTLIWLTILRRAHAEHRKWDDARSLRFMALALAMAITSLGTSGPLLVYLGNNLHVFNFGVLDGVLNWVGRVLAGAGRVALFVAGLGLLLDRGMWNIERLSFLRRDGGDK